MILRSTKIFLLSIITLLLISLPAFSNKNVRMALCFGLDVEPTFLQRAQNAVYTHALVAFAISCPEEWENGVYTNADGGSFRLRDSIRDAFLAVHHNGMRMIPCIGASNRWSGDFNNTNNVNIDWSPLSVTNLEVKAKIQIESETGLPALEDGDVLTDVITDFDTLNARQSACPSFAPDADGYDRSFRGVIQLIAQAYELARAQDNTLRERLEFIHIGRDEPITFYPSVEKRHKVLFGQSALDKRWIYDHVPGHGGITLVNNVPQGDPTDVALQYLMADELNRRANDVITTQVNGINVLQDTKIMFWADMWDPNYSGGYFNTYPAIDRLDAGLKDRLVFIVWNYKDAFIHSPDIEIHEGIDVDIMHNTVSMDVTVDIAGNYYDANNTMDHFAGKGYTTAFAWAYPLGDPHIETENLRAMFDYVDACKSHGSCIGFCAAIWNPDNTFLRKWGYYDEYGTNGCTNPDDCYYDPTRWDVDKTGLVPIPGGELFRQSPKFNALELLQSSVNDGMFARTITGDHNTTFFGYLWTISTARMPDLSATFMIDRFETTKLDYLVHMRNTMYPDCDYVNGRKEVTYCEALEYCNVLSEKEGLEPVYTLSGWRHVTPIGCNSEISGCMDPSFGIFSEFTIHPEKNGYRLPTCEEIDCAMQNVLIYKQTGHNPEWCWNPEQGTTQSVLGWRYYNNTRGITDNFLIADNWIYNENGCIERIQLADVTNRTAFRVVRNGSNGDIANNPAPVPPGLDPLQIYVSDLAFSEEDNGWGHAEIDRSNGEMASEDGNTITINGVSYEKGLGVHAYSSLKFLLNGEYAEFCAKIGVDDEEAGLGSVIFKVFLDGQLAYQSNVLHANNNAVPISVDVTNANEMRLVVTDGGDGQNHDHADWADARLIRAEVSDHLPSGRYKIQAVHSGKCLDVAWESVENGGNIIQWWYNGTNNQKFDVTDLSNGFYKIINVNSGKALDVEWASQEDGANLIQWCYHGGDNQQFSISAIGEGQYVIEPRHSGKAIDVYGISTKNGANVVQWNYLGGENQKWIFTPVQ